MATGKVTKRSVESLETLTTYNHLWDTDLKGFGVRVTPKGKRVYIIQYKAGDIKKRTRRITIGSHGVFTADQAREQAKVLLGEVASGKDPAETRDIAKNALTMAELLQQFSDQHISVKLKARTAEEYKRAIKLHIPQNLQNRSVTAITRQDISKLHHKIKGSSYQANRTIATLSKFFNRRK